MNRVTITLYLVAGYLVVLGVEDDVDDEFVYLYVIVNSLGGGFPLEGNVYNEHD